MELGIGTYTFPWAIGVTGYNGSGKWSIEDLIAFSSEHQVHHVQIADNLPLHEVDQKRITEYKAIADSFNIRIQVGTRKLEADHIRNYIRICQLLQSPFLRVVIDDREYEPSVEEVINIIRGVLAELKSAQIVLAIENHDRLRARELEKIIESTDSELIGICLDTANSFGAGEGFDHVFEVLAPHTVNLHIKDFRIRRLDHKMGFRITGCGAGEGMLNIPVTIEKLERYGRCKTATLEIWSEPASSADESIRKEFEQAIASIDYLKKYLT
jgi:sugar phosphate isomerase/epimerase